MAASPSGDAAVTPALWAGQAWADRAQIEHHACRRFARLSQQVSRFDPESPVAALLAAASREEAEHARLCEELARTLGVTPAPAPDQTPAVAPSQLNERERLLYEVVAACCVAETESMATLTMLLLKMAPGRYREVVHRIAKDEVEHAQAGWAHLAREASRGQAAFLSAQLVPMLDVPAVRALFAPAPCPAAEDEALWAYGVVPHTQKRKNFRQVAAEVICPGLSTNGVDPTPLQLWLTGLDFAP